MHTHTRKHAKRHGNRRHKNENKRETSKHKANKAKQKHACTHAEPSSSGKGGPHLAAARKQMFGSIGLLDSSDKNAYTDSRNWYAYTNARDATHT